MASTLTKPRAHHGRLELTWTNKDMSYVQTAEGDYDYRFVDPSDHRVNEVRLLHELSRHAADTPDDLPEGHPTPTTDNLLINGDSMHALRALAHLPEYAEKYRGKVKLVYLDPPFNTGKLFGSYDDNLPHSIWLTMMRDRFRQIKELLSDDGSVWVHLDDSEVHRARCVMDEVFGADNFVTEVVWQRRTDRDNRSTFSKVTDSILVYAMTTSQQWKKARNLLPRESTANYSNPDNDPRGRWMVGDFTAQADHGTKDQFYTLITPAGKHCDPSPGMCWRYTERRYQELLADNRVWFGKDGNGRPSVKRFLSEVQDGLVPKSMWTADEVGTNNHAKGEIHALFPGVDPFSTPKPERLLQRIIHIGSNPGDIVLDPFGGSGTTAAVAHKMGRRWVTCELLEDTFESFTKARLLKVINGEDRGGISVSKSRVEVDELPGDTSPEDAALFNTILSRAAKQCGDGVDPATIRALKAVTRTKDVTTVNWVGGGGFTAVKVGPSMFDAEDGYVFLADWATKSALARAVCAQIGVRYVPDGIFCGTKGSTRYVVVDGMVNASTLDAIISQTPEGTPVHVWATQFVPDAEKHLRRARSGSKVSRIPTNLIERYRRTHRRNRFNNKKNGAQL